MTSLSERATSTMPILERSLHRILALLLSMLLFLAGMGMGENSFLNAQFILHLEILFILMFCLSHNWRHFQRTLHTHQICFFCVACWALWTAWSLIHSPFGLIESDLARHRFIETPTHILFSFTLYHYFILHKIRPWLFLYSICASVIGVASVFIYQHYIHGLTGEYLYAHPPINEHIRHVGYQTSVGVAILLLRLPLRAQHRAMRIFGIAVLIFCLSFLLWMAGRSQSISIFGLVLLYGIYLFRCHQTQVIRYGWQTLCICVLAIICSGAHPIIIKYSKRTLIS